MGTSSWPHILNPGTLIALLVGILLTIIGAHFIINNKVVVNNLLQNVGIFQTKEIKREEKEISQPKLIFNRIMLYIVGGSFVSMGLFLLFSFLKKIITIFGGR